MIVPVARLDVPAERPQLRFELAECEDLLGRLVGLQLVPIDDRPQIPDALMRCRRERLPVLPFLKLAVAGHHDDAPAAAEEALRPRHAPSLRQAHAEGAGVRFDAGYPDVGVAVEPAEPSQPEQPLRRDDAERMQGRIQAWHVVALRREEDVPLRIVPADFRDVELAPQEVHDDVQRAERRADVTRACALDGREGVQAAHVGEQRQRPLAVGRGGACELFARDEHELRQPARR